MLKKSALILMIVVSFDMAVATEGDNFALAYTDEGPQYVEVMQNGKMRGQGEGQYAVRRIQFNSYGSRSTGQAWVQDREDLEEPLRSVNVSLQSGSESVRRGSLIKASGDKLFIVEDVFPDGIVAFPAEVNRNSRRRIGNFVKVYSDDVSLIPLEDVEAVEVDSFYGYKANELYENVLGLPLCKSKQKDSTDKPLVSSGCRVNNKAMIDAVLSDGTMVSGTDMFNPFPKTIRRYDPSFLEDGIAL